jgi:cell wall-associated NlpC family hydrolase
MLHRYKGKHAVARAIRALPARARIGIATGTLAVLSMAGLVLATNASASTTITIRGGVSCSYHPVTGVWVQSSTGGSTFASWSKASPGGLSAAYSASIAVTSLPASIELHVGCGAGASQGSWWSDNWTPNTSVGGSAYLDATCNEGTSQPKPDANTRCAYQSVGNVIVAAAAAMKGYHYCWDGGTTSGPSHGAGDYHGLAPDCTKSTTIGFDCTGLSLFAVFHATDITLPHGEGIWNYGTRINSPSKLAVGDVVLFGGSPTNYDHVGIYAGNGMVWDANTTVGPYGDGVLLRSMRYEYAFVGAVRF